MVGDSEAIGPRAGDRLGAYELLCVVGRGGFAVVWLARLRGRHGFEKLVAIKTIRPELARDADFETMFIDEARIAAAVEHPNVAGVVDFGEERDTLFLVMEYVPGDAVSSIHRAALKREISIPIEVVVGILADTCGGLHAAHELRVGGEPARVIHRDVSPQNILVTESGIPKLVDFGIAKATNRISQDTSQGLQKGKVRYMAPEQVMPDVQIDHRVDIYAVAALGYELLAGRPVHDGPNDMARMHSLLSGRPVAPLPAAVVPDAIGRVLCRALSFDREARHATALELREDLLDALATIGARPSHTATAAFCAQVMPNRRRDRDNAVRAAIADADARAARATSQEPPGVRDAPIDEARNVSTPTPAASSLGGAAMMPPHAGDAPVMRPWDPPSPAAVGRSRRAWPWISLGVAGFAAAFVVTSRHAPSPLVPTARSHAPVVAVSSPTPPALAASAATSELPTTAAPVDAPMTGVTPHATPAPPPPQMHPRSAATTAVTRASRPSSAPRASSSAPARKKIDDEIQ